MCEERKEVAGKHVELLAGPVQYLQMAVLHGESRINNGMPWCEFPSTCSYSGVEDR
jgi:hypothetical protein